MVHGGGNTSRGMENIVSKFQQMMANQAIIEGFTPIIDDTNLNPRTRLRWKETAEKMKAHYREVVMDTPLEKCIARDAKREGKAHVGAAVIHRQFLESGRLPIDKTRPIVIVDVDGTLAWNDGSRGWYDEELVQQDWVHEVVAQWVRLLAEDHTIFIVSGRHSTCGDKTIWWLNEHKIPFHFIAMRHAWDSRPDEIVKREILDALLKLVPKEQIDLVLDDRPKVVRMWRENGLRVIPVAGACEEF
jgi:hypothetical protein